MSATSTLARIGPAAPSPVAAARPPARFAGDPTRLRVAVVADMAATDFGGEAILPYHHFRLLRKAGVEAWLVVQDRRRDRLAELFADDWDRVVLVPDPKISPVLSVLSRPLPERLRNVTFDALGGLLTQRLRTRAVRQLVAQLGIDVVHQPISVSPREPSALHGLGAPVVIGPMNGGMTLPPAFRDRENALTRATMAVGRSLGRLANRLVPGKRRAATLLVANARTRGSLPLDADSFPGRIVEMSENGVDLSLWKPIDWARRDAELSAAGGRQAGPVRFVFCGRLVRWKGVDLLLEAFAAVAARAEVRLEIIGDGPEAAALKERAAAPDLAGKVEFAGWLPHAKSAERFAAADAFVLPSLYECGGAVVLEAMAAALPVIATDWGGPADYLSGGCGLLVPPDSREGFVGGLADAMLKLAESPVLRRMFGESGRRRVERQYDWEANSRRMLDIYAEAVARHAAENPRPARAR
jgi:glycosyltransferase involved in cell wall biosynthesis